MSGGVDSSVAAMLLVEAGCAVVGVTMKLWNTDELGDNADNDSRCCSADTLCDARTVARRANFPFLTIDSSEDFSREVIADFVREYQAGRTPNPCVVCNAQIKWPVLEAHARKINADFVATGHYARIELDAGRNNPRLLRGIDDNRDQSYFLWSISPSLLRKTVFPLGSLTKDHVRHLAREFGLPNAERPESREVCFVTDDNYGRFLREQAGLHPIPGDLIDQSGKIVGRHQGVPFYTIGQRKGIGAHGVPAYVTALDPQTNTVHIGPNERLMRRECFVTDINWVSIEPPAQPFSATVKIRYRHDAAPAQLSLHDGAVRIVFAAPQRAITPGQSAVFYDGDIVLGGGRIERVLA